MGEQTFRATEKAIDYVEAEPVEAKGKSRPGARLAGRAGAGAGARGEVHGAALVGRERELELLAGALDRARRERSPELVTIVGVPGIGKSRLVLELCGRIEREQELTSWRHGRCLPYGEGITFWALGEMVKAQAGILEDDDEAETERKLRAAVDDPWIESHLRPLVGLSGGPEGGGDRREEAFTAWRRFFEGLADERPLVLVFEDLHWADENLLDFVDHLIDWASGVPLLVVCTARPELLARRPGWGGGKPNAHTISLSPLSDEETTRLLERAARPFARACRDAGRAARARRRQSALRRGVRAHAARARPRRRPPETVQGLIAARLDLLEPEEKALVQNAAVLGKSFWLGALELLTGEERGPLEGRLHALERKEFVRRERSSSVAGDVEYSFRHLLVRDVAYGQIPRAERAEKHRAAAEWLEGLGRPEDHAEMLAYHYLQALELAAAASLDTAAFAGQAQSALADAGQRAFALGANDAAVRYYRAALELLPANDARRGPLLLKLGNATWQLGEGAFALVEQARDELLAAGNAELAGEAETRLAEQLWLEGDRDAAFAHLQRARELVDPLPPSFAKAHAISTTSRFLMLAPRTRRRSASAVRRSRWPRSSASTRSARRRSTTSERPERSWATTGAWRTWPRRCASPSSERAFELCRAKGNLAAQLWLRGQLHRSIELWLEAGEDARRFGQLGFARWFDGVVTGPRCASAIGTKR